ncbi:hypothetical protein Taro_036953 [Colocasia esculenta]|uniref:Uncharacterized protein n=1 Tax=Colocasia esculenta TaxID=4460 RepID=A0A843W9T4_COLES|nr:hypothetical protein [Colocasia esculenta]
MECSCKVLCKPCRRRLTLRLHSKPSWRLRKELMYGGLHYYVYGMKTARLMLLGTMAFDHRTLDEALSAACRQEGEMEQYLEEKKASQKRPAATFQRQDKKKAVYQTQQ